MFNIKNGKVFYLVFLHKGESLCFSLEPARTSSSSGHDPSRRPAVVQATEDNPCTSHVFVPQNGTTTCAYGIVVYAV